MTANGNERRGGSGASASLGDPEEIIEVTPCLKFRRTGALADPSPNR